MKKISLHIFLVLMWCNVANANLFNLNTYAYCSKSGTGTKYANVRGFFAYISFDNNYIRFKYSPYERKFLIETLYVGKKILKTNLKDKKDNILYKIEFNKETGQLYAKGTSSSKGYFFYCKKIKKRELPKSKF